MSDLAKIILTFLLTGGVGVYISFLFQKRNAQIQIYFKVYEKKATELKEVRVLFEKLSSDRLYRATSLLTSISECRITDKERDDYRNSVSEWNKSINFIFIELNNYKLFGTANRIEKLVHDRFKNILSFISSCIDNKEGNCISDVNNAFYLIHELVVSANEISASISSKLDEYLENIANADGVPMEANNLQYASTLTLLIAIFHPHPHRLRISRSRFNR